MTSVPHYGVIYAIHNTLTGHIYIGQSVNVEKRWQEHRRYLKLERHSNRHLQRAWQRDGEDAFEFAVLETADTAEALDEAEQFYIAYLRSCGAQLYNFRSGGHRDRRLVKVAPISEVERQRRSQWARRNGIRPTEQASERARQASIGRTKSPQEIERWRASNAGWIGKRRTPEFGLKVSAGLMGKRKPRTPALLAKWEAQRGRKETPEQTARRIAAQIAKQPLYRFVSPDGAIHETRNVAGLAREHGLHPRLLGYVVEGKQHHHRGWRLLE